METRTLGPSGVEVSVLGLGTWPMGGEWWGGTDDAESIRTIHRALDLGVTLFDTAEAVIREKVEAVVIFAGLEVGVYDFGNELIQLVVIIEEFVVVLM